MKPTWDGWEEVYASQSGSTDVTSYSDCLYEGRWGEHNDVTFYDWQTYYNEEDLPPISWNHCVNSDVGDISMTAIFGIFSDGRKLWEPTDNKDGEPVNTIWYPVEYPN